MEFIDKNKRVFKSKLTFEQFAIAITSDVRMAVIKELGLMRKPWKNYNFKQIKYRVSDRLDRGVSSESLTWHLEKLKDAGIIEETSSGLLRSLTSIGREVFMLLEKVEREMEEVEMKRRLEAED